MIDRDIPLPDRMLARGRPLETRWDLLDLGDALIVESLALAEAGRAWANRNGRRFLTRKLKVAPYGWRVQRFY